jgi:hypothetical protein
MVERHIVEITKKLTTMAEAAAPAALAAAEPWKESKAKKVLREDIISGFVTSSMSAKDVYNDERNGRKQLYAPYKLDNFTTNLRNLRKTIATLQTLANEDSAALERELQLYPPAEADLRGFPVWNRSKAKACLEQDVTAILAGTLEKTLPRLLHASREEYKLFPLTKFRDHYYKELIGRNESAYWIVWKLERKQAKEAKKASKSNKKAGR